MKTNRRAGSAAFTLIEMMAVITIIVILAGIVVGGMGYVNESQARKKTEVQIKLLEKALEEYKMDMGKYPGTLDDSPPTGNISSQLYRALFYDGFDYMRQGQPANWPADKPTKIYLPELNPFTSKQGWVDAVTSEGAIPATTDIKDAWGTAYRYRKGSNAMNPGFDIWSAGKNGKTNNATTSAQLKDADGKDDIRNF